MKKTVSWSKEAMKRDAKSNADTENGDASDNAQSLKKSSSTTIPLSNVQVNSRIQQMIAMQKAQNASMRQLMSTGGPSSASPSGLRDLVMLSSTRYSPVSRGAEIVIGKGAQVPGSGRISGSDVPSTLASSSGLCRSPKFEPLKPASPDCSPGQKLSTQNQPTRQEVSGIHFQGPQSINTSYSLHQALPAYSYTGEVLPSTALNLHADIPKADSHVDSDSPISYNSVLDQNFSPSAATQQIRNHHQLQVNQSQPPIPGVHNCGTGNVHKNLNMDVPKAETNLPIYAQPVIQLQQKGKPESQLSDAYGRNFEAVPPLKTNNHHKMYYGSTIEGTRVPQFTNQALGADHRPDSPLDQGHHTDPKSHLLKTRIQRRRRNLFLAILCHPFQCLIPSERICRSFCFGAIDGMLTGAGILFACVGLGLVPRILSSDGESTYAKWVPIALTLAATLSDGICMAIGHVWSTYLDVCVAREERTEELRKFEASRSDAKARLVDTLLMQGMLKIDAMCLADTLEGYPDLFVSALLGGGLSTDNNQGTFIAAPGETDTQEQIGGAGDHRFKYESYSGFSDFREISDHKGLSETVSATKMEGFVMMLSFSSFSVVPGLIYILLPSMARVVMTHDDVHSDTLASAVPSICVIAVVMFILGVWKSCFYLSNWLMFGLKNMGVLAICISTAYFVGHICGGILIAHQK